MASKNVELGTVGFNLEAFDDGLAQSLATLRAFGDQVTRAANATDEAGIKSYNTMVRVERILTSAFDRVHALTEGLKGVDAGEAAVAKLTSEYDRLVNAMVRARGGAENHEFVRAQVGITAATQQATRTIKEQAQATALADAKATALVSAYERLQNLTTSFKIRGAGADDLGKLEAAYNKFHNTMENDVGTTGQMRTAQRQFNMELGETNRELRENIAQMQMAERQQTRYIAATRNVAYVNARVMRTGLPSSYVSDNNAALQGLGQALAGGNQAAVLAAQNKLNDAMMATRLAMAGAEKPTSAFALAMKDMSKASVLALGPLSGIGARISVMTALLESNTVQTALFIGGAIGMAAALYKLSEAAIKASSEQQKFDALLTVSTGSTVLVKQEYEYLLQTANKMGVGIKGLVQPYADFQAASRSAGFTLEQQRKIYESLITTGTALRWNHEQTGRAFLAITQMISKTTVMSEEYKKQLGELIPNVIGLGAAAEGTSTQGLLKMMQSSKLMAIDHLPKLAEALQKTFGPGAIEGAKTLSADVERLHNSMFEFMKAADAAAGASSLWQQVIQGATAAVDWMRKHVVELTGAFVALAGAGAGYLFAKFLTSLPSIIGAAVTAMTALITAVVEFRTVTLALQATTIIGWVITLASAIYGAAKAYTWFSDKAKEAAGVSDDITGKMADWIAQQKAVGETSEQTRIRLLQTGGQRITDLQNQTRAEMKELARLQRAYEESAPYRLYKAHPGQVSAPPKGDALNSQQAKVDNMLRQLETLQSQIEIISNLKVAPEAQGGLLDNKRWDSWEQKVLHDLEQAKGKVLEFNSLKSNGVFGEEFARATTKAILLLNSMPKEGGPIANLQQNLKAAGYGAGTLKDQLTQMFLAEERAQRGIHEWNAGLKDRESALKEIDKIWADLINREKAAKGTEDFGADHEKKNKEMLDNLDKLRKAMQTVGSTQDDITEKLNRYAQTWKEVAAVEDHQKEIQRVTKELDAMGLRIGDNATRYKALYDKQVQIVQDAVRLEIITQQQGDDEIAKLHDDLYRKLTKGSDEYFKALDSTFKSLETTMTDALSGKGAQGSFKKMLNSMLQEITAFLVRISIVKPFLTNLFGGLYTNNASDGNGMLGGLLQAGSMLLFGGNGMGMGSIGVGNAGGSLNGAGGFLGGGRAVGGAVNPWGEYDIGENGPETLQMGASGGRIIPKKNGDGNSRSGSGGQYVDNSHTSWHIDGRADVAQTMMLIARMQRQNNEQTMRRLKVRYG